MTCAVNVIFDIFAFVGSTCFLLMKYDDILIPYSMKWLLELLMLFEQFGMVDIF